MKRILIMVILFSFLLFVVGCNTAEVQSVSGTKMTKAEKVQKNGKGLTVEQQNINDRIKLDNTPGAIKHLYVISAMSGQVIIYSTVRGKVTSSGKRLTPSEVDSEGIDSFFEFFVGEIKYFTRQVLGEDGTFGPSEPYLYWWDTAGRYHQHYVSGGQILHISDQPLNVGRIIINMEANKAK